MKSQEDEFYAELDRKTLKKSCCTMQTLIIFFLLLLIISLGGVYYGYKQIKKSNFSSKIIQATFEDKKIFAEKLKIAPGEENFEIAVTSEELTAITSEGISAKNFIIKNIQAIIQEKEITIFGTLTKPLSSQIQIETLPKVEEGKIKFEVKNSQAGSLNLPSFINEKIASAVNGSMDQNFGEFYKNYEVQSVTLFDDRMVISGKLKN